MTLNKYIPFDNPPIVEALLDIRVQLPSEVSLGQLEIFQENIKGRFPEKHDRYLFEASINISPEMVTTAPVSKKHMGFLFRSSPDKKVVQARLDGFTFSKLAPYKNWDTFQSEAKELWDSYFELFKPVKMTRLALRYINRIQLHLPMNDFKEYVLTVPEIAPELPQGLEHFFMQIRLPHKEKLAKAIISQTLEPITPTNILPYIFDIDVFQNVDMGKNDDSIWEIIDLLRDFKNEIFFKSITKKSQELFK